MNDFLDVDTIPHGLREQLKPIFSGDNNDSKAALAAAREMLERLLYHLSSLAGIHIREVFSLIEKLASEGTIDFEVKPYFHLWWSVSCLGSHFQPFPSQTLEWDQHLAMCRNAIGLCLRWYLHKYPPLSLTEEQRCLWLQDASAVFSVSYSDIQVCCENDISSRLKKDHVLLLTGRSWVGKTSLASRLVTDYVKNGYIPLVIHENSLATFRALPNIDGMDNPKNLRLASNSQVLHEIITTALLHGESFVLFLDDPFGHRHFKDFNPLMYLKIAEWLKLASESRFLGQLKVIITSPSLFLEEARLRLADNAKTNPIAHENLTLLEERRAFKIDIPSYTRPQIIKIVSSTAKFHNCSWSNIVERCEIVADALQENRASFDSLHVLCRNLKTASDDEFLGRAIEIAASADITDAVHNSLPGAHVQLCAALVGESLIEFYREFCFQTKLRFDDICLAADALPPLELNAIASHKLSDWLLADKVSTLNLSEFPVFSHPEVRHAVATLSESRLHPMLHSIVSSLCGLSDRYSGKMLSTWEAAHLLCRMAAVLTEAQCQHVNEKVFFRRIQSGGDPRNILWAILGNWNYIHGTSLEHYAFGFLKSIPHSFKRLNRPFIWEATENWTHLHPSVRLLVLLLTSQGDNLAELKPFFDEHTTLTFLAAGVAHYGTIQETARAGCETSEKYFDFMNIFIAQLLNPSKQTTYRSQNGDGLFESPGNRYSGRDVCQRLKELGFKRGSLAPSHPLVALLDKADSIK